MNHQVVNPQHPVVGPEFFEGLGDKLLVGSFPEQRTQRLADKFDAGNDDEYGNGKADDAVQHGKIRESADHCADEDRRRH